MCYVNCGEAERGAAKERRRRERGRSEHEAGSFMFILLATSMGITKTFTFRAASADSCHRAARRHSGKAGVRPTPDFLLLFAGKKRP